MYKDTEQSLLSTAGNTIAYLALGLGLRSQGKSPSRSALDVPGYGREPLPNYGFGYGGSSYCPDPELLRGRLGMAIGKLPLLPPTNSLSFTSSTGP